MGALVFELVRKQALLAPAELLGFPDLRDLGPVVRAPGLLVGPRRALTPAVVVPPDETDQQSHQDDTDGEGHDPARG